MLIVDTHCHAGTTKYEPIEVLLFEMERNGVEKAVLIQHMGNTDNRYLLECARHYPGRFSVVAIVDTEREDAPATLEKWAKEGASGVRLRATTRSPGKDTLAIWRKARELEFVASCYGRCEEFASEEFRQVVESFPSLHIVIEHLASVGRDAQQPYTTYRKALALSRYSNTYIKIPGFGEITDVPINLQKVPPLIEMAYDSFGASRMMWGSDFPPVASREGYHNSLWLPTEHIKLRSQSDKEWIFGKTALSVWRFIE
jgi:L-fuconolactonase